ncbi:MAG: hypothetical protein Q4F21_02720 [Lachnospiraceae bacterium]|nr:hypothetical protein [Lachnospiraceae bacterium]
MKKQTKRIMIFLLCLLAAAGIAGAVYFSGGNQKATDANDASSPANTLDVEAETDLKDEESDLKNKETDLKNTKPESNESEPAPDEAEPKPDDSAKKTDSSDKDSDKKGEAIIGTPNPAIYGEKADDKQPADKQTEQSSYMTFPYQSEDDNLLIQSLFRYSGYYIEDGSEEKVEDIAAIKVKNTSSQVIEYGKINLTVKGKKLSFEMSLIPPKSTVIIMESGKKGYSNAKKCLYEGSTIAYLDKLDKLQDKVKISTNKTGGVTVTNISEKTLPQLRVFYKNQLDSGEYIGGIAYTVKIENLKAGESQTVTPSHFDSECGTVMMVRAYD